MAITANFRPARQAYRSTYEPFPFQEVAPIAMRMQQEYNKGIENLAATEAKIESMPVASADEELAQYKIDQVREQLRGVMQQAPDARSPEFNLGLNKVISSVNQDKFWQDTAHNAKMEQEWMKAINEAETPADKLDLQLQMAPYQQLGTAGYGKLSAPAKLKREDWGQALDKLGANYVTEGQKGIVQADGQVVVYDQWKGVLPQEVAAQYGYNWSGQGRPQFVAIPEEFYFSSAGQSMRRDAQLSAMAKGEMGEDAVQAEMEAMYQRATLPKVYRYSGLQGAQTIQGFPGGSGSRDGGSDKAGIIGFAGDTAEILDSPAKVSQVNSLNERDTASISELNNRLRLLTPGDGTYRYIKQQIRDLESDIAERNSRVIASKGDIDYDNRMSNMVKEGFFYYQGPEFTNDIAEGDDLSPYFEPVRDERMNETFQLTDFNGDGALTLEDLSRNVDALSFYEDAKAKASTSELPADFNMNESDKALYAAGRQARHYLQTLDKEEGLDYYKNVSKITGNVDSLNKELDKVLKSKAITSTYNKVSLNELDTKLSTTLSQAYNPDNGSWIVEDEDGILSINKNPRKLEFTMVTQGYVPNRGYIYEAKDEEGKVYKVSTETAYNIGSKIGQLMMNKSSETSDTWEDGFRMKYPGYARDVDKLVTNGGPRIMYNASDNREVATVEKINRSGHEYFIVRSGDKVWGEDANITKRNMVLRILDILDEPSTKDQSDIENIVK